MCQVVHRAQGNSTVLRALTAPNLSTGLSTEYLTVTNPQVPRWMEALEAETAGALGGISGESTYLPVAAVGLGTYLLLYYYSTTMYYWGQSISNHLHSSSLLTSLYYFTPINNNIIPLPYLHPTYLTTSIFNIPSSLPSSYSFEYPSSFNLTHSI